MKKKKMMHLFLLQIFFHFILKKKYFILFIISYPKYFENFIYIKIKKNCLINLPKY